MTWKLFFAASGWKPMCSVVLPRREIASLDDEHYSVTTVIVEQTLLCLFSNGRASAGTTILESKRTELTNCPPTQEPSVFQQVLVHSILRPSTTVARIIWNVNYSP